MLLDKLNVRVKEIGDKYKEPVIKESKPRAQNKKKKIRTIYETKTEEFW